MNYAIVLSGGTGSRAGTDIPKQYLEKDGHPMIWYTVKTIYDSPSIEKIVIVASTEWADFLKKELAIYSAKIAGFASPGENRQLSVLSGMEMLRHLEYLSGDRADDLVLIQDAARPYTSSALIEDILSLSAQEDGRMPVLPMKDTIYTSIDGKMAGGLLNRSELFAGQAPESFRFAPYYAANLALMPERIMQISGSTEPALLSGMRIAMIPGEEANGKVTTPADVERWMKAGQGQAEG